MEILLDELYNTDLTIEKFNYRKVFLDNQYYQINGVTNSGKTKLAKNYLLSLKKNTYLYLDCSDVRIDINLLNSLLPTFCINNHIDVLVLDNYNENIKLVNVEQIIIISEINYKIDKFKTITLFPLDYEEFLTYEQKYDSSALNHFFKLGALPSLHKIPINEKNIYIQKILKYALSDAEFDLICLCAKYSSQKISAYTLYERLKTQRKISKDKLYLSFENLLNKHYIHQVKKYNHDKATKKLYLCDISLKSALSIQKDFGKLFENMVFLELLKSNQECYYDDEIDFFLPNKSEIILCKPFGDERVLFKKLEKIEAFIFINQVKKVTAITMNNEGEVSHPFSKVELLPFDIWALGD